ncbi:Transcriptional regulatory protein YycF [compost metagenome]
MIMKRKIIICEDNTLILDVLALALTNECQEVIIVSQSRELMTIIEEQQPDLLITDLQMPWVAGDEIVLALKASEKHSSIKVIMISASLKGKEIAAACGADAFLAKPFELDELEYLVDKLCPSGFN